jgi:hypothetical protein
MARVSKRLLDVSDDNRVAVPGLVQQREKLARYTITPLGHVYRDDKRLLTPNPGGKMNFNGGKFSRSLALLVFLAFGKPSLVKAWNEEKRIVVLGEEHYDVWVDPCGPTDELTGRLRCTVNDVKLVPHGELIKYGRRGVQPATQLSIL